MNPFNLLKRLLTRQKTPSRVFRLPTNDPKIVKKFIHKFKQLEQEAQK